jgi:hypothetical protein
MYVIVSLLLVIFVGITLLCIRIVFLHSGFKGTLCGGAWARLGNSGAKLGCCPIGSFMSKPEQLFVLETSCSKCPAGQAGSNEPNDDTSCPEICPAGQTSSEGATSCQNCTAGKYSTAAGSTCTNCVAGKSSLQGKTSEADCTACEEGQYSLVGSACKTCVVGKQFVNDVTECAICSKGKYQSSNAAATALCKECVVGRYIVDDGIDATQHESCKTCPLGYEIVVDDVTEPCEICTFSKVRKITFYFLQP